MHVQRTEIFAQGMERVFPGKSMETICSRIKYYILIKLKLG